MTTPAHIQKILDMPHTHEVVTTYRDGAVKRFSTRSLASAEMHAVLNRRNIGRVLLERGTDREVMVVSVEVRAL